MIILTVSPMLVPLFPGGPGAPYKMDEAHTQSPAFNFIGAIN